MISADQSVARAMILLSNDCAKVRHRFSSWSIKLIKSIQMPYWQLLKTTTNGFCWDRTDFRNRRQYWNVNEATDRWNARRASLPRGSNHGSSRILYRFRIGAGKSCYWPEMKYSLSSGRGWPMKRDHNDKVHIQSDDHCRTTVKKALSSAKAENAETDRYESSFRHWTLVRWQSSWIMGKVQKIGATSKHSYRLWLSQRWVLMTCRSNMICFIEENWCS